jgi:hypothetical protein
MNHVFLSETIFRLAIQEHKTNACPVCFNDNSVSLVPLAKDEVYQLPLDSKLY